MVQTMTTKTTPQQFGCLGLEKAESCLLCGNRKLRHKFDVRHITSDALHAWATEQGFPSAPIAACQDCGFLFKSVRPSIGYLDERYSRLDGTYMQRLAEDWISYREDYRIAREILRKALPGGGSILDVGCASGFFLESLGETWQRHGLEISHLAAQLAKERKGIVVHECDIASAKFSDASFDAVCSFDVVEHLAEPMAFFREARRVLKPSGLLLLGTGDAGSLGARLSGNRWTYLCIPEHISFFSRRSLGTGLRTAGFSHVAIERIHHGERNMSVAIGWLRAAGKHWAIAICGERIIRLKLFRHKSTEFLVPYFLDHLLCTASGETAGISG